MSLPITRRALLLGTGAAVMLTAAGGPPRDLRVVLEMADGGPMPKGRIEVFLRDPARPDDPRLAKTKVQVVGTGKDRRIAVDIPLQDAPEITPTLQVVAQMSRKDGWLLARGSAGLATDQQPTVILHQVVY